ncbi:MAG TPA: hypothetical protein VF573_06225 [Paraburkholderia sp.]|uniref:hypothetical protein n=1 Tax=Paraburkholderia sp. TaxID=1926495 RepID=UPI002ED513E4
MKCSNTMCFNQFETPANSLGECAACHQKHVDAINSGQNAFVNSMVAWMTELESRHGKTIFYSDEFKGADRRPFTMGTDQLEQSFASAPYRKVTDQTRRDMTVLREHLNRMPVSDGYNVTSLPKELITLLSWNGMADGFVGASKNFHLMASARPCDSIRNFIRGRLTVCECEAAALVVFLNSICDLVGDAVFNVIFRDLKIIGTDPSRHNQPYIRKTLRPDESTIQVGDWVYFVHSQDSMQKFQDTAQRAKKGGAASGWNLVCIESGGGAGNKYLGFGMSDGAQGVPQGKTLMAIRNSMILDCGGDPADKRWDIYLHFTIRPNYPGLQRIMKQELKA